ncbi:MAG TPA: hypothetical protein VLT33_11890 [Labilithrix sp.]|nr:hypothetical protein [Labilithrix sp.]
MPRPSLTSPGAGSSVAGVYRVALVGLVVLAGCAPAPALAPAPVAAPGGAWATDTNVAWAELQRVLVGSWKATTAENRSYLVSYRVVSNGSALVETFTSGATGKETLSVYHRDGGALVMTHYCAQGNQARLKATHATGESVVFAFLDATNVAAEQDVMQRLSIVMRPDGFDQVSVYRHPDGVLEAMTLRFYRAD